jgi:hypothetical protein
MNFDWHVAKQGHDLICRSARYFFNFGNKQLTTSTPRLKTNRSYDQNFLKKISIKCTINMSLNFSSNYISVFRLRYRCYYFRTERQLIRIGLDLLKGVYSTPFHNFELRPSIGKPSKCGLQKPFQNNLE